MLDKLVDFDKDRNEDISQFPKWIKVKQYLENIKQTQQTPTDKLYCINNVHREVNKAPYVEDITDYAIEDYWATPQEFLANGGDCEDYAICKYARLLEYGFDANEMELLITYNADNIIHCVLLVKLEKGLFVLDNQSLIVRPESYLKDFTPIFGISLTGWKDHRQ